MPYAGYSYNRTCHTLAIVITVHAICWLYVITTNMAGALNVINQRAFWKTFKSQQMDMLKHIDLTEGQSHNYVYGQLGAMWRHPTRRSCVFYVSLLVFLACIIMKMEAYNLF